MGRTECRGEARSRQFKRFGTHSIGASKSPAGRTEKPGDGAKIAACHRPNYGTAVPTPMQPIGRGNAATRNR